MTDECNLADRAYSELISDDTITISKLLYEKLLEDEKFLTALCAAGVDNWDGYDYALEIFHGEE